MEFRRKIGNKQDFNLILMRNELKTDLKIEKFFKVKINVKVNDQMKILIRAEKDIKLNYA